MISQLRYQCWSYDVTITSKPSQKGANGAHCKWPIKRKRTAWCPCRGAALNCKCGRYGADAHAAVHKPTLTLIRLRLKPSNCTAEKARTVKNKVRISVKHATKKIIFCEMHKNTKGNLSFSLFIMHRPGTSNWWLGTTHCLNCRYIKVYAFRQRSIMCTELQNAWKLSLSNKF